MSQFKVSTTQADAGYQALEETSRLLEELGSEGWRVYTSLSFQIRCREQVDARLRAALQRLERQQEDAHRLAQGLSQSMERYQAAETAVVGEYEGAAAQIGSNILSVVAILPLLLPLLGPAAIPALVFGALFTPDWGKNWPKGSLFGGSVEGAGEFLGIGTSGSAHWNALGYELSGERYFGWSEDGDSWGAAIKGEAEGYLLQGGAEGQWGLLSGDVEAAIGQVGAYGEAKAVLFEDGTFQPEVSLGAGAEASGATGEVGAQFGTDDYNVHVGAEGTAGHAVAEAGASISDEGVSLKAEVGAAALEGEVEGGFTLFGFNVDVSASGAVGAVGAGGEFNVTTNSVSIGGNIAALLGLGLNIKVSW